MNSRPLAGRLSILLSLLVMLIQHAPARAQTSPNVIWNSPTNSVLVLGRPYPLSATASSGLPVTFRVESGAAVIVGDTITVTNVGPVVVVAQSTDASLRRTFNTHNVTLREIGSIPAIGDSGTVGTYALAVIGNLAYRADGFRGLQVFDIGNLASPQRLGYLSTTQASQDVQVAGHYAYVSDGGSGLQIVDVSNPANPVRVGNLPINTQSVRLIGQIAYASYYSGNNVLVAIVDVSDPTNPRKIGGFGIGTELHGMQVTDHIAFIAADYSGLRIFDVSDPAMPRLLSVYKTSGHTSDVHVVGNRAYVADGEAGLQILDVSNPITPVRLGGYATTGIAQKARALGNLAFVVGYHSTPAGVWASDLQILDVSNPASPGLLTSYSFTGLCRQIEPVGNLIYVTGLQAGTKVLQLVEGAEQTLTFTPPSSILVTNPAVVLPLTATASSGLPVTFMLLSGPATLTGNVLTLTNHGTVKIQAEQAGNDEFLRTSVDQVIEAVGLIQTLAFTPPDSMALGNPVVTLSATASSGLPVTYSLLSGPATLVGNQLRGTNEGIVTVSAEQAGNLTYQAVSQDQTIHFFKKAQSITWLEPSNAVLRLGQPYPLAATADSGLPVSFRVQSGPAVLVGNRVTATNVGTIALVAEQAGNSTYTSASSLLTANVSALITEKLGEWPGFFDHGGEAVQVVGNLAYIANTYDGLQIVDVSNPASPARVGGFDAHSVAQGLQVVGNLAYVAYYGAGLQIVDVSDAANPVRTGQYLPLGDVLGVQVVGNLAYLAVDQTGLQIVDVSNPAKPVLLGSYYLGSDTQAVQVVDHLAYVTDQYLGLQIIDVSNPAAPSLLSGGLVPASSALKVKDNFAYVATRDGLQIFDVSKPTAPVLVSIPNEGVYPRSIRLVGNLAYCCCDKLGLIVLDVSNPANPVWVGSYSDSTVFGAMYDIDVQGDRAYLAGFGLKVLQLHEGMAQTLSFDPPNPVLVTNFPTVLPLVATASSGLPVTFEVVSGPATLTGNLLSFTNHGGVLVTSKQAGDAQYLPVTTTQWIAGKGLDQNLLSVDIPSHVPMIAPIVELKAQISSGLPARFTVVSGAASVAGNLLTATSAGTVVVWIEQPGNAVYESLNPTEVSLEFFKVGQTITASGPTNAVLLLGQPYPLSANADSGLPVNFRVQSGPAAIANGSITATGVGTIQLVIEQAGNQTFLPASLTVRLNQSGIAAKTLGQWSGLTGEATALQVSGNLLYLANGSGGLQILDISDVSQIKALGSLPLAGNAVGLKLVGNRAYVAAGSGGLKIVDVNDPAAPTLLGTYAGSTHAAGVDVTNIRALLADQEGGFQIVDIRNPAKINAVGYSDFLIPTAVQVVGSTAFVAESQGGLLILDFTNPANPTALGRVPGSGRALQVVSGYVYLADGQGSLLVIDARNKTIPVLTGSCFTGGKSVAVNVAGNRAYVASREAGLQVADVSDPHHPVAMGGYVDGGTALGVQVVDNRVYLANGTAGLEVLELREGIGQTLTFDAPTSILVTNSPVTLPLTATASSGLPVTLTLLAGPATLEGNILTITDHGLITVHAEQPGNDQLLPVNVNRTIASVADTQTLTFIPEAEVPITQPVVHLSATASSGLPVTLTLVNGPATLVDGTLTATNAGRVTVRAEQPGNFQYQAASETRSILFSRSGQTITWLDYAPDVLSLGRPYSLAAVASSGLPVTLQVEGPGVYADGFITATNVGKIVVVAEQGLDAQASKAFNVPPLAVEQLSGYQTGAVANDLQVVGNLAYVANGTLGLQIFDISNPLEPVLLSKYAGAGNARALQIVENRAYVGADLGFEVFDVSDPSSPVFLGRNPGITQANKIQVLGSLAYVADGALGLQILDVSNPARPVSLTGGWSSHGAHVLQVAGNLAYLGTAQTGLDIFDVSNPGLPLLVGSYPNFGETLAIQLVGDRAYLGDAGGWFRVADVSDPSNPKFLGFFSAQQTITAMHVVGDLAYLTTRYNGLLVIDLSDPTNLVSVGGFLTGASGFSSVQVVGQRAYLMDYAGNLGFFDLATRLSAPIPLTVVGPNPPGSQLDFYPTPLGQGPATFQWLRNDQPLVGETNEFLHLPEVTTDLAGNFTVLVTAGSQQVLSDPAMVYPPEPVIQQQPADREVIFGLSTTLSVSSVGLLPPQYQWRHEGTLLPGQTGTTLPLTITNVATLGGYDVVVSNPYGMVTSQVAQVTLATNVFASFPGLSAIKALPDGRLLVSSAQLHLMLRLLPDFSQDLSFPTADPGNLPSAPQVALQPDGKFLLLGSFTRGLSRSAYLRRLNADGSADLSLVSLEGSINPQSAPTSLLADGSGRLLVSGAFGTGGPDNRALVRLLPDGSRDPVFAANFAVSGVGSGGKSIALSWDGRLVLGGTFRNPAGGTNRNGIVRLDPDGNADEAFATGSGFSGTVNLLALDRQERVLVTGGFSQFNGINVPGWARLKPDGSLDSSFAPTDLSFAIVQMETLRSGEIVVRTSDRSVQVFSDSGALVNTLGKSDIPFAVEASGAILLATGNPPNVTRIAAPTPLYSEVAFAWGTLTVDESAHELQIPLWRTGPADSAAEVAYHLVAGTAMAGVDFLPTNGVAEFTPGVREIKLTIPLTAQNSVPNDDRTVVIQLDSATGASLAASRSRSVITIKDDDTGLNAEVFASQAVDFFGPSTLVSSKSYYLSPTEHHLDRQVYFEWDGAASRGATNDYFAVIWTGWIVPEVTGQYQLAMLADDGSRIWLDDILVMTNWTAATLVTAKSGLIQLEANTPHRLVINYFEQYGQATCRLLWSLPGTNRFTPVPQRVLRPDVPELVRPTLSLADSMVTFSSEAGRPVTLQTTQDGIKWRFLREAVSAVGGVTNSFKPANFELPAGTLVRAVSVDGLMATNAVPPQISVTGQRIYAHETNAFGLSIPAFPNAGQSVAWYRDGTPVATGTSLMVSGLDPHAAGSYQAIVTFPFGQVASDRHQLSLIEPTPPIIAMQYPQPDGSLVLDVTLDPTQWDQRIRLEISTDLMHWNPIAIGQPGVHFVVPAAAGPAQFVRAVFE